MSPHDSGPNASFRHGDTRVDFTDLYVFPKPGDPGKTILVMDVHPSTGVSPIGPTTDEPFEPGMPYTIKIDMNGDAVAELAFQVSVATSPIGTQSAMLRRLEGTAAAATGVGGKVIVDGAPVSMGREARVTRVSGYRFFTGWRSDPLFRDVDVRSIVLEVPSEALGPKPIGLWACTSESLLPDVLHYDPTRPVSYPENGRALRDNAADADDLLAEFPYVGSPHRDRTPAARQAPPSRARVRDRRPLSARANIPMF